MQQSALCSGAVGPCCKLGYTGSGVPLDLRMRKILLPVESLRCTLLTLPVLDTHLTSNDFNLRDTMRVP